MERRRVLTTRLLALEILPMIGAVLLSACWQHLMPLFFLLAAMAIFTNVALSLREGAVSDRTGIYERHKQNRTFWFHIAAHSLFGAFFLAGSVLIFLKP